MTHGKGDVKAPVVFHVLVAGQVTLKDPEEIPGLTENQWTYDEYDGKLGEFEVLNLST